MKFLTRLIHVLLATALASLLTLGTALAQNDESALKMVKALGLGSNLAGMSYNFAKLMQTQQGIAMKIGPQKADELLRAELAVSVLQHQDEWDRNLAQAWAPLMSAEEFESLASKRQQSPYVSKFMSLQNQAGSSMKIKSQALLEKVMSEAVTRAFEKSFALK